MHAITDFRQLDQSRRYTYADYLTWQLKDRIELIMGKIFRMSPAPSAEHQQVVSALHGNIYQHVRHKTCKVFPAPFDVVLPSPSGSVDTVVQPDVTVICDTSKITGKGCLGPPDLVVEVASPGSVKKDLHEKYLLYEGCGVKEYWLVLPAERTLIIFTLDEQGKYRAAKPLTCGDHLTTALLPGMIIDMDEVFRNLVEEPEEGYGVEVTRL